MDLTNLDFQQARIKQVLFKSRLRSVLYGVRDADPALFSVRENPLSQWLDSIVKPRYGASPQVREIERLLHDTLTTGQALVRQYQRGQIEEARKGLEQIESRSNQIDALLQTLAQGLDGNS